MAERVHAFAVEVRHRAGGAKLQVAGDEHHADGVARLERAVVRHFPRAQAGGRAAHGHEALLAERAPERVGQIGLEAGHHERRGDRAQQRAELVPAQPRDAADADKRRLSRPVGKGSIPVEGLAKRRRQIFVRERKVDVHAGAGRPDVAERGRVGHFGNRRDARDRLLRKGAQRVRDRADQAAVDVHGAAAHPGDDPGRGERAAFQLREDQIAVNADDVLENADDVDLELLDAGALEDGVSDPDHPGSNLLDTHLRRRGAQSGKADHSDHRDETAEGEAFEVHKLSPVIREKCLLVKEK